MSTDSSSTTSSLPLPITDVHQFYKGAFLENISVRPNGRLLVTFADKPELHSVDPASGASELIYSFPNKLALSSIAEAANDVFLINSGDYNISDHSFAPSSTVLWKVDFNHGLIPKVSKLTAIPECGFLNGAVAVPSSPYVLFADSQKGLVWRVNAFTAEYDIVLQGPELLPPPDSAMNLGINGIRIHKDYVYWTNNFYMRIYKTKLASNGTVAPGAKIELVHQLEVVLDDFAIDGNDVTWATTHANNTVIAIGTNGRVTTVAGSADSLTAAGTTSAAFGRRPDDKDVLYVSTDGGLLFPINGTEYTGGKVFKMNTKGFKL